MKKINLILMLGMLPMGAYAYRNSPGTCHMGINGYDTYIPSGYCCIEYYDSETGGLGEHLWNCDNLHLSDSAKNDCKNSRTDCINYCSTYDLDNDTCNDTQCTQYTYKDIIDSDDCTIPNATLCDYTLVCDNCGNCHREDEKAYECTDEHWYTNSNFTACLKCPGNGVVDWDMGNAGITTCYIPRTTTTGSDSTGTFKYVNNKCYYKE